MIAESRRFTILEHSWNGVHWDILIEDGQALRTWAIDELPVAGRTLEARSLPPHRRVYLDYEGEVSGGRGLVRQWDSGTCEVLDWREDGIVLRLAGRQMVGVVELRCRVVDGLRRWEFTLGKFN